MQELSASELSMLWLLRDRHTTKQAVEKAILNELPLWPEAVHLARAYHRSKKDLAGGKYYILGSDFVENETNSPYSYHELGRYPINKRRNASVPKNLSTEKSEQESSRVDVEDNPPLLTSSVHTQFPREPELCREKEAISVTETNQSNIDVLLGDSASADLENLLSDRSSLDVCQISEDGCSECEAGGATAARPASAHTAAELRAATVSVDEESGMGTQGAIPSAPPIGEASLEQEKNASELLLPKDISKKCAVSNEPHVFIESKRAQVPEKERPASPVRKPIFDFSEFESEIMRQCERLFRPRSPVRNFSRILSPEEFREMCMRDGSFMTSAKERENSTSGNSEMEDVEAAVLAEFDKIDEELEQAIMSGEVMETAEEVNASRHSQQEAGTSKKEKPKRCYVYPFDDSSSVICSDFSDDDIIGTNIFMEISEHRRVEGASSPSSCSEDSDGAPRPNLFVWLPQPWTCDINLVTHFRSPSPSAKFDAVLPMPYTESVWLAVSEPKRERITSSFTYSKNPSHCGAFARKRGARLGPATSFSCPASKIESTSNDCDISNPLMSVDSYHAALVERILERASISCKASSTVIYFTACDFRNHLSNDESYETVLGERLSEHATLTCQGSKYDELVSSSFFEIPSLDEECSTLVPDSRTESALLECKAAETQDVGISEQLHAKAPEISDTLEVLPSCSVASSSFSCSAPTSEAVTSSWVFDVQIGSGTAVTIRDNVQWKAGMHCRAISTSELMRRSLLNRLPPRNRELHEASMEECLLLLELGAMPSQSIDVDPCPQNSPCSSTSSRKSKTKTRRKDSKGAVATSSSTRSKAVNFNEVNAALATIYEKPTTRRSAAESMSSRRSDLSDSPDRLVIVEDLEGVIVKDPPPDEMPMSREVVTERKSSTRASLVPNTKAGSSVAVAHRLEGESNAEPASSRVSRRSPRKRRLEQCAEEIIPPPVKKRITSSRDQYNPPLPTDSPIRSDNQVGVVLKTRDAHDIVSSGKNVPNTFVARLSPSTSTTPSADIGKSPKHLVVTTDKKRRRSPQSLQPESHAEPILPESFRTPDVTKRSARPMTSGPTTVSMAVSLKRRTKEGIEAEAAMETCAAVISKASEVVSSYATTVRAPTKLQPRPVSDSFCLSADVDSTVKVATRLAPADGGDLQSCPPTPRPIKETRKSARSRVDLPTVCAELAVAFKSKSRSCSCVGVSIVTEEFENVEATFKEYRMKVHEIKHDRLLAKQQHSVVKGTSAANAHREVGDSSTETQSRAPVTRRQRRNLQSNNPSINTYQRSSPSSASGTLAKAPVPVDSVPSKSPSPIIEVQSKVHASCQNGKPLNTPASAIPTRSRICKHASTAIRQSSESQNISNIKAQYASSFVGETLSKPTKELAHSPAETHSQRRSGRVKRPNESTETAVAEKRKRSSAAENISCDLAPLDPDTAQLTEVETLSALLRRKSSRLLAAQTETVSPLASSISKEHVVSGAQSSSAASNITTNDDVVVVDSGYCSRRRKSSTPPLLVVAVEVTSSFVPVKRDNERSADPITLPTYNFTEPATETVFSSDSAEILNALALDIIIREASALSTVNMATFAQFVFNLFEPVTPTFGKLVDVEPSNLPANFTTIFELASPLQFRHRLDYNSFNNMLMNRLPENGLHALTLDSRKVSMLKITKFVDTIKEAVSEICEELRTRRTLSKAEVQAEKDLSSEVQHLITSRYVETMMKLADECHKAQNVSPQIIADRFHLLLCGWNCFLQQGGALRVRLQLSPMRSHPGIIDVTTAWLDQIDAILSRAQATLSTRTSAFAVSLAQEKNVMNKIWQKMAAQTSPTCNDESYIHCSECKLYFHNEDTDFMHNRVFHQKSRECEECYDMFHTLLGLDLHMVGNHKRIFATNL